ncbi:globin [Wenzhouxiangella sp. EGI_FJ10409]|uniref:globin n=1 Tax=Wenzhouxiangella sp. EGI_FJ10409 TaxID=3243767 RepID=UPI0035DFFD00
MSDPYADVQASYGRCTRKKGFITRFYELLLASDERMAPMFSHTDWTKQNKALRRGISIALTYAGGSKIVERPLKEMADVHSRKGHAPVDPELYGFWRRSLLQAVREHDDRLTPVLEDKWAEALKKTTDFFVERH